MQPHPDEISAKSDGPPWYLIWVLGATILAGFSIAEFRTTEKVSSLLIAVAWFCWAFSWYAKPFHINFRAKASRAIAIGSIRSWVPPALWNIATFGAFALLTLGIVLKLTNAA